MSCRFYWWNNHYACRKSEKDVDEDTYYRYCRDYNYDECPIYKGDSSGGCFLTSACAEARGLPDDCHELTVLRSFRDGYLRSQPEGEAEIAEYYAVAPKIVEAIRRKANCVELFDAIYRELVEPCVAMIERGENVGAHTLYRTYVLQLKDYTEKKGENEK